MSNADHDVLQFIQASFPSVWALELLLLMKGDPHFWDEAALVARLRASDAVVTKALAALEAAGLVATGAQGAIYRPVTRDVEECVGLVETMYRTRPNAVRRAIVGGGHRTATAFADAFRLRGGGDD